MGGWLATGLVQCEEFNNVGTWFCLVGAGLCVTGGDGSLALPAVVYANLVSGFQELVRGVVKSSGVILIQGLEAEGSASKSSHLK